ncbi:MAG: hypothetical protein HC837_17515 [Chloroflexaceae bacterium]|nr:hypothetical protein [Chloroflexaceae bacterium]
MLAEQSLQAMQTVQAHGPYQLAGWSAGGVLAFEMARQLEQQGEAVDLLVLIDSFNPALSGDPAVDMQDQAALLLVLLADLVGCAVDELPLSVHDLRKVAHEQQIDVLLERAQQRQLLPSGWQHNDIQRLLELFRVHYQALYQYTPVSYGGQMILFETTDSLMQRHGQSLIADWQSRTPVPIEVYRIAGNHYTVMRRPSVTLLAQQLQACLERGRTR